MVILPVPTASFNSYRDDPRQVLQVERRCPECKTRTLSQHGRYMRWIYFLGEREQIPLFRLRCRPCRLTVTLLPDSLIPYGRHALEIVEAAIGAYIESPLSYRAVAMAISAAEIPENCSVTDALLWIKLVPGYQRLHAWVARVAATAATDVQAIASWLLGLNPASIVADVLAVPLNPLPSKSRLRTKQQGLAAARLLMRLFRLVPELNPHQKSWFAAWRRFAATILPRLLQRGPPREPQSS